MAIIPNVERYLVSTLAETYPPEQKTELIEHTADLGEIEPVPPRGERKITTG